MMASTQRPILLLSPPTEFYAYQLAGLANGLKSLGYTCDWLNASLDQQKLAAWARRSNACAVIEINRILKSDVDWPKDIAHLAWIQDYRAYGALVAKDLGVSDHLYFLVQPSVFGVEMSSDRAWSILLPGVRTDVAAPGCETYERDFGFAGYIPAPPDLNWVISAMPDGRPVTLGEILAQFPADALRQSQTSLAISNRAIDDTCARIGCAPIEDHTIRGNFDEDLVRIFERKSMLEAIAQVSSALEIYGPPSWKAWPQFAAFYRGFISDPRRLDRIFQTTKINLHNGVLSMHFRVLDCLAAGGFMMINETGIDTLPGGIRTCLEPFRHYVPYQFGDVAEVARRYLADPTERRRIALEGRRAVLAEHSWVHRARQILHDLGLPVGVEPAMNAA
jgi:hypothetical protein